MVRNAPDAVPLGFRQLSLPIPEDRLLFKETFMQKSIHSFVALHFLVAFLVAGAVFFTKPTIAAPAESPCNLTVNDAARVLTTTQLSAVTSAAKNLEASALNSAVRRLSRRSKLLLALGSGRQRMARIKQSIRAYAGSRLSGLVDGVSRPGARSADRNRL